METESQKLNIRKAIKNTSTIIGNFLTYLPKGAVASLAKFPKFSLTDQMTNEILTKGLYHCVPNEGVADIIISSEYLKASGRGTSYGLDKWLCLFAGPPDIENYMKNLTNFNSTINPFVNPKMVVDAIKYMPDSKDLGMYKCRSLNDEVILYQGNCVLPPEKFGKVKLVPDLVRDEHGVPIKNDKGEYDLAFREATKEELSQDGKSYNAKEDYLAFIHEKAKDKFFVDLIPTDGKSFTGKLLASAGNGLIDGWNRVNGILEEVNIEGRFFTTNVAKNYKDIFNPIKDLIASIRKPKIPATVDGYMESYDMARKNPLRDLKMAKSIGQFQSEGLSQYNLKGLLDDFSRSDVGTFTSEKNSMLDGIITKRGIHGKSHTDRVALMAMIIAKNEGIFQGEDSTRLMDILYTAATLHDLGRVLDVGPHAARGARRAKKLDLKYLDGKSYSEEDKNIVLALIEGHEGKPDKIFKLMKKYKIEDPETQKMVVKLNSIVRDADALDRVRIDTNFAFVYKTDLNPNYLVNDTSKQMILPAYELEYVRNSLGNIRGIIDYKKDERNPADMDKIYGREESQFDQALKVDRTPTVTLSEKGDNEATLTTENRTVEFGDD